MTNIGSLPARQVRGVENLKAAILFAANVHVASTETPAFKSAKSNVWFCL